MQTVVQAEDIHAGERQRKEFKDSDLQDLADSILRVGLIHAPVVQEGTNLVIAGERRLRALALTEGKKFLYGNDEYSYPELPVHFIDRDDPKILFEIELEENLRRVNLSPLDQAQAVARLHHLRAEEHPGQTLTDTSKELSQLLDKKWTDKDRDKVADSILVDQFKDDPEVKKAAKGSLKKAAKVAKKKMELQFLRALGGSDLSLDSLFTIFPGTAEEILPTLPDASFDILLFDPPYGVQAHKFGEQAMDLGHQYEDDPDYAVKLTGFILKEGRRLLKPNAHVLMFCAFETLNFWMKAYDKLGYTVWPRPLIWSKGQQSHVPVPDFGPRYSYECILFAGRGRRKIARLVNDVFTFPPPRDKIHAAEKPSELLAALIDFLAKPGDSILDPCTGSGSIFSGARGKEIHVTGIEKDPNYYAVARERAK